jgi:ketosteroid isomerase-like protein
MSYITDNEGKLDSVSLTSNPHRHVGSTQRILESALAALNEGRVSELVEQFDERFKFNDYALTLEFTDKTRLTDFLQKARELYPDTALEVLSIMECGDRAIAEWRLTATQTEPYGSISYRFPISVHGSTIVRVQNGKIVEWSDYYDQASSRRTRLASLFIEWIDY